MRGALQGKEQLVLRLIRRRLGDVPASLRERVGRLTSEQLDDLGEALLDVTGPGGLEQWLSRHE